MINLIDMPQCVAIDGLPAEQGQMTLTEFAVDEHDPLAAMLEEEALALWNSTDVQDRFADAEEFCEWYMADCTAA